MDDTTPVEPYTKKDLAKDTGIVVAQVVIANVIVVVGAVAVSKVKELHDRRVARKNQTEK